MDSVTEEEAKEGKARQSWTISLKIRAQKLSEAGGAD